MTRTYLRPTAFIDSPVGFDGTAMRLAGGLQWFSAVEVLLRDGGRVSKRLLPVSEVDSAMAGWDDPTRLAWQRLTGQRPPLQLGARTIRLDQPQVMGIVNATPDSFSDGGVHDDPAQAIEVGHQMASDGAAIIDVGGESTRPGAQPVWEGDEVQRVLPIVRSLAAAGHAVSVDTRKAAVMAATLEAGATLMNDVSGLTFDPRSAEIVAAAGCPVVLMHHQGDPQTMQDAPRYDGPVLLAVYDWLEARIDAAVAAGIARDKILIDPGIGFGKTVQHNLELMNGLGLLHGLGCPLLLGASRKRTIGALSNEAPADKRLGGSIAFAMKAIEQGAHLIRVHDVFETVQAIRVWRGMRDAGLTAA